MENTLETNWNGKGNTRIELVGQSYVNTALMFLTAIALAGLFLQILILIKLGAGITLYITITTFLIVFGLLFRNFWRSMATAYIRGEMVIVKYLNKDVRVTELRHIKVCRSHKLLGFNVSSLKFRLDGKQHRVLLFGNHIATNSKLESLQKAA